MGGRVIYRPEQSRRAKRASPAMTEVQMCARIVYIWLGPAQLDDNVALSCIERGRDKLPKDTEGLECCVKI